MQGKKPVLYQFSMWNMNFAVDVEAGNFFEVDEAASEAIGLMGRFSYEEAAKIIKNKHNRETAQMILGNLSRLFNRRLISRPAVPGDTRRQITDLTLNIVNSCNLRCRYCWNQSGAYGRPGAKNGKMLLSTAIKAIDLLVKGSRPAKDLVVDFYGGEPLLNFSLIKGAIEYCAQIGKKNKINFHFLLATNGTLLNEERGRYLIDNGVDIAVSLDGERSVQDTQRPFFDGRGSYEAVMGNISRLGHGLRRRIVGRATFTPYHSRIIKTFKFLRNLGFERIEICESEKAGYGLEPNNRFFFNGDKGLKRLKSLYYGLAKFYAREILKGRLNYENTYFNRFFKQLSRLYHIQSVTGSCSAAFSLMACDINGDIYPCTAFIGIPGFAIGNVRTGLDEREVKEFSNTRISSSQDCSECWARRLCLGCGSCYNLNYFASRKLGRPDSYYCELFRYKTKLMIAMISEISNRDPGILDEVLIPEYYAARGKRKRNTA